MHGGVSLGCDERSRVSRESARAGIEVRRQKKREEKILIAYCFTAVLQQGD